VQTVGTVRAPVFRGYAPGILLATLAVLVGVTTVTVGPLAVLPVFGLLFLTLVLLRPEYGIALFLSTFLMTYPQTLQGSGALTINNVLGGVFLVLLTYKVYQEEDWWFLRSPELHLFLFIILMFYLSGQLNGPDPRLVSLLGVQEHGAENLRTFVTRVAFVLFFINFIRTPQHVRMIYVLALAFMVVSALTGIQGVLRGGGLYGYRATTQAGVIASAFNPNRLAMFAILAIAGLWYLMRALPIRLLQIGIIPTVVVLALSVVMSASRSGLLGLAVCIAMIVLDERLSIMALLNLMLAMALLVVLALQFVPERSLDRIVNLPGTTAGAQGEGSGSLERREYGWLVAFEMFRENPILGVGIGNWELARFLKDPAHITAAPHSSYILALVEGGILCLAAFLALFWRTWQNIRLAERHCMDPDFPLAGLGWIVKGMKTSLAVLAFFSLFADLWQLVILFWLVGLSIVIRRLVEQTLGDQPALAWQ